MQSHVIRRLTAVSTLALFLSAPAFSEDFHPKHRGFWRKFYRISQTLLIGANAADAATSRGRPELNPVLAGRNGRFGGRGLTIKAAIGAGWLVTQEIVTRHDDGAPATFAVANTAAAAALGAVAVPNARGAR